MRLLLYVLLAGLLTGACRHTLTKAETAHSLSHAGASFLWWNLARSFPDGQFHTERYLEAMARRQFEAQLRGGFANAWEAIGPDNIGGRTLCLTVHPQDTNILWVGSASGGLWKSTTAGRGVAAWQRVETGFPVLGVSAIAIDPEQPNIMYAGTGEVYNVESSSPNVAIRVTRGTYGIGILKSTDGGQNWSKCLDWGYGQLRGVQDIKLNPKRAATVYAATTEGLLRSYNRGTSWDTILKVRMAVDIELHPTDTNTVFVSCGSLDDQDVSGVYRSTDGGQTFSKLANGLPVDYSGKTLLAISPNQPNVIYASVGDAFAQRGLYKSTNNGSAWVRVSSQDVCTYQGWYSHDIAIHPLNPNILIWVGIDTWKSVNGGTAFSKKSFWSKWYFGVVPAGSPEGPFDYVHADIHRAYFLPQDPNKLYLVTDGGIFVSYNGGESFSGRNGGYQTQQFYANMGHSAQNPNISIGGMQDNSTAIYSGKLSWRRVLGGDGECAAISPANDQIMYGSSQYLNMSKSTNGGLNFYGIGSPELNNEAAAFNGPFDLAPSNPDIMYAGAERLHRSDDGGESFSAITPDPLSDGDVVLTIGISPKNPDVVYCSTAPLTTDSARVFKVNAGDGQARQMWGLPNRLCMDIAVHPLDDNIVYAAFAGFNTAHVYRSTDAGDHWEAIDAGLPDVPTNSILIDPLQPDHIYIGNDLGVWLSTDAGANWSLYSAQAPQAMLAMHLGISADRKLRVGTYGLGVWQTEMLYHPVGTAAPQPAVARWLALSPNPAVDRISARFELVAGGKTDIQVVDAANRVVYRRPAVYRPAGVQALEIPLDGLPGGWYGLMISGQGFRLSKPFFKQ